MIMSYNICFHLLSVISVQCFVVSLAMTSRNLITDQFALLEFKERIVDPHKVLAKNWTTSNFICNWVGVSCGVIHERVTALNLTDMNLTGTIPPHLSNLSFLVSLDLSSNHFYGILPKELGQLHRLRLIQLSFNGLNGEIPSWLGNLHRLQILELSSNKFSGVIPRSIGNLAQLKELHLGINNLEGEIPEEIGNLLNLEMLNIQDTKDLTGQIPTSIFNISSLKTANLSNNSLSGSLSDDLCRHLPKLEELYLDTNGLSGNIPSSIGKCSSLQILVLSINQFSGMIPRSIGNLTRLKELHLGLNNLEGEIPEEIGNLLNLEMLNIPNNKGLTGRIPTSIFNISSLKTIILSNNSLSGSLPNDLYHHLPKLEDLELDTNKLSGNIPRNIGNLTKLKYLYLGSNNLQGSLPPFTNAPNLEGLSLTENKLSGNIPNSISNSSMLRFLDLESNFLSGRIPDTLGNLRHLEWLYLGYNNLTTESPTHEWTFLSSLANSRNLAHIDFTENPLNGFLPTYIGNLSTSVLYFYADYCELKGKIPMEIGNLSSLLVLSILNNTLSGSIPTSIGGLRNVQELDLNFNKLGGPIPESICGGLERINYLDWSSNKLHGPIHTCFSNMTSLRYLYLESNKLSYEIPSALWNLQDILELDLSSNNLITTSNSIDVGGLRSLLKLNLSRNLLTGDISPSIGGLLTLTSLDLSNNQLHGHIPDSFGGLISLEYLDLCNNNLSGLIPKSLEKLLYLKYFNVSVNRLEGEIPSNGRFSNFSSTSFMNNYALCGPPRFLVPHCKINSIHKKSKMTQLNTLRYGLSVICTVVVLIVLAIIYRKRQISRNTTLPIMDDLLSLRTRRRVSQAQLSQATGGFEESNMLGSGSFGCVYKGRLSDGMEVAIKVFNLQMEGAFRSFEIECEAMRNIVHRNLVRVITCCSNIDFKALVLDFMSNGSLDKWLHSQNRFLDILQRVDIMIDVATALEHLHTGHPTPIIHCDLKPSNILLDEDMVAHVGDFGISKLLGEGEDMKQTITLATIGYMAPEFGSTGIVSIKCDVYSFGIVLMETFTKKKPTDVSFVEEMSLRNWMKRSLCKGMMDVADAGLLSRKDEFFVVKSNCISSIMELALDCSTELPEDRKDMKDVVVELKKIKQRFLNNMEDV